MATRLLPAESSNAHQSPITHPKGTRAKVLLSSVFGPFARDDEYGSRKINPMELWHNQVTRVQGAFSLRMFNRSWGLQMIQANIEAPCVVLDFPTLERFEQELREHRYDVVGITAIPPNVLKVEEMCRRVRQLQPDATIVVGGHVAAISGLEDRLDADWIVPGEGVKWFRQFLGDDTNRPIRHPQIESGFGVRTMGNTASNRIFERTATLIPSVGCPLGCDFCSTSQLFGGKGKHIAFYETGDALYDVMCRIEKAMDIQSFFVMDENFLLYRPRALRLLKLMEQGGKSWSLQVFSSANVVRSYSIQELVRLGLSWLWVGLEGEDSGYAKLKRVDTFKLIRELRSHGVRVLGSTILGFPHHTPDSMGKVIDYAVRHNTDFHQFMFYSPSPGTPFYREMERKGQLKDEAEFPWPDWHGQLGFSWRHPNFASGEETKFIEQAFHRDLDVNGPSVLRAIRTVLQGRQRYKQDPDARLRRRFARESRGLGKQGVAAAAAAKEYYRDHPILHAKMSRLLEDLCDEFGDSACMIAEAAGPPLLADLRVEETRIAEGWTYEPSTFYEVNAICKQLFADEYAGADSCRYVEAAVESLCDLPLEQTSVLAETPCP
jgi:radical SAM superfamily enzyme YgiQ (UPF0313 family)